MISSKQNLQRNKKKLPPKNRYMVKTPLVNNYNTNADLETECASSRKLKTAGFVAESSNNDSKYFVFMDIEQMKKLILPILYCPKCDNKQSIEFIDNLTRRMGFAHLLELKCTSCGWINSCFTSKECHDSNRKAKCGRKLYESNVRAVISFREIGRGKTALKSFTNCFNMYGIGDSAFDNLNDNCISTAYAKSAEVSMKRAASEFSQESSQPVCKRVKIDGSWQKRGHASLNGVVTAVVGDKVLDYQAFSKHCKGCSMWRSKEGTPEHDRWKINHDCHINHTKSSGAMEAAGAIQIFARSIQKNNIIYSQYLGDGDTSSFKEVDASDPYKENGISIEKLECIGHVQKRLGTRVRNLVKNFKGTKTPIHGKGKLTDTIINSMQNYYGLAIRKNSDNVYAMKKAIGAILYHCTAFNDPASRHAMCPRDKSSWCKWQLDRLNSTKFHKDKVNLPIWIYLKLKPIFQDLSDDKLLTKCLHGQTQNANEAFNAIIWTRCPKNVFLSRKTFELAINSAVLHFNDGGQGVKSVLECFGIKGQMTSKKLMEADIKRAKQMKRKSSNMVLKQRKKLRKIKKGKVDKKEKAKRKKESQDCKKAKRVRKRNKEKTNATIDTTLHSDNDYISETYDVETYNNDYKNPNHEFFEKPLCENNHQELTNIAKSAIRFKVSNAATSAIATATLIDYKNYNSE